MALFQLDKVYILKKPIRKKRELIENNLKGEDIQIMLKNEHD